jgi:hypothetical protein
MQSLCWRSPTDDFLQNWCEQLVTAEPLGINDDETCSIGECLIRVSFDPFSICSLRLQFIANLSSHVWLRRQMGNDDFCSRRQTASCNAAVASESAGMKGVSDRALTVQGILSNLPASESP